MFLVALDQQVSYLHRIFTTPTHDAMKYAYRLLKRYAKLNQMRYTLQFRLESPVMRFFTVSDIVHGWPQSMCECQRQYPRRSIPVITECLYRLPHVDGLTSLGYLSSPSLLTR